jgi:hypothetical protein
VAEVAKFLRKHLTFSSEYALAAADSDGETDLIPYNLDLTRCIYDQNLYGFSDLKWLALYWIARVIDGIKEFKLLWN